MCVGFHLGDVHRICHPLESDLKVYMLLLVGTNNGRMHKTHIVGSKQVCMSISIKMCL